jgi:undecaprenyl-diphosphatase
MPYLMNFKDPGVLFDLCLHIGTAAAVILYFRERIFDLCKVIGPGLIDLKLQDERRNFVRNFVFATGVSVFFILLLKPWSSLGRNPWIIMTNQAVFGLLLWYGDVVQRKKFKSGADVDFFGTRPRWFESALIGAAQALAIFPGVSRSGITLTTAFLLGLERKQASSFSFLLSLPIIVAGVLVEIPHIIVAVKNGDFDYSVLIIGVVVSFAVGLLTIHFFLKLISRLNLVWFTGYRFALAGLLLYFLMR